MNRDLFFSGLDTQAYRHMGCHKLDDGVEFTLWAPHAERVEVFMSRDDFQVFYPLEKVDDRGIWHLVLKDCACIYSYRYRIWKLFLIGIPAQLIIILWSRLRPVRNTAKER